MQKTFTLKANSQRVESVKGKVVACISSTGVFNVELDNGGYQELSTGRKISGDAFKRVTFVDTSGSDNTITFYIGNEDITLPNVIQDASSSSTAIANNISSCIASTPSQILKTNGTPGTPVALTAAQTYFRKAIIIAQKTLDGLAGAANTGNVAIGASGTAAQQPILLTPGDSYVIDAPIGGKYDFRNFYLDVANAGDGVVVIYS